MRSRGRFLATAAAGGLLLAVASGLPAATAETSRALWERRVVHAPAASAAISGDTLWVVGTERRIHSLSAANGKRHWRRNLPSPAVTPPVPRGELLFLGLGSPGPAVIALDRRSGRERWLARLEGVPSAMALEAASVAVATAAGEVAAFSILDGSRLWQRSFGRPLAGIVSAGESYCVLARSDSLWCIDPKSGAVNWAAGTDGGHATPPIVCDSLLLASFYDGGIVAYRVSDGLEIARSGTRSPQVSPVSATEGAVVTAAAGGEVETFHLPSLDQAWSRETGETVSCGAIGWGDWWIVPTLSGRVLALTRARGVDAWDLKLRAAVFLPPAANRAYLALVDERGRVIVYRLEEAQ